MHRFYEIDTSSLPPPQVVEAVDVEIIRAEIVADFIGRYPEFTADLESEPTIKLIEAFAFREMLLRIRINDAAKALLVGFAVDADLDHLAAFYGVRRRVIKPATQTTPAVYERDEEFRYLVQIAPEAFTTAGSQKAYIFHASQADSRVIAQGVDVWSPAPGVVNVAIQSREGDGTAPPDLLEAVRTRLTDPAIRPMTSVINVFSVVNKPFDVDLHARVLFGPNPQAVKAAIIHSVNGMAAIRRRADRDMPLSAIITAATVSGVDRVDLASPAANIAMGRGEVPVLRGLAVEVTSYDG